MILSLSSLFLGTLLGVFFFYLYGKVGARKRKREVEKEAKRILHKAHSQSSKILAHSRSQAKNFESRARKNAENEIYKYKQRLKLAEESLKDREKRLDKEFKKKEERFLYRVNQIEKKEEYVQIVEEKTRENEKKIEIRMQELQKKLERVGEMSQEEAEREFKKSLEVKALQNADEEIRRIEEQAKAKAEQKARAIVSVALARYAGEVTTERTVSTVSLPNDEMKGKIIGREGRNIRALESSCGVDVIVDETPESVVISCFDPVRREIARQTLLQLMEDGRVHPARIEEVVEQVKKDFLTQVKEDGEKACLELGLHGVHPALIQLVGHLKYRQIENQNLYKHSIEVAHIAGLLAEEISYSSKEACRAGLFHAIGYAIDHTVEGSYAKVGADYAKKYGEKEHIVQAIRAHNDEVSGESVLAPIIQTASQIALTLPGAKHSMTQKFIRRLEDLESIGNSFDGVLRTFAIQAGKEIHVLVDSAKITDDQSSMLSRDIARKIERELNYPGQVKITVIRETRVVEHAR